MEEDLLRFTKPFFPLQDINILSFQTPPFVDPFTDGNDPPVEDLEKGSIWDNLKLAITAQVKRDGILGDAIQPGETEESVTERAISQIYYDVADFYEWYFNPDDDRSFTVDRLKKEKVPAELISAVAPVVSDGLDAMREVDEIPAGIDVPGLEEHITDTLARYILNWQDWFYLQKEEEDIDNYYEIASFYDEIYNQDEYGALSNLIDDEQYDGVTDVPYIAEQ